VRRASGPRRRLAGVGGGADDVGDGVASLGHAELVADLERADAHRVEPAVRPPLCGPNHPVLDLVPREGARRPSGSAPGDSEIVDERARVRSEMEPFRPGVVVVEGAWSTTRNHDEPGEGDVFLSLAGDDCQHTADGPPALGR
jgi:hypothetical protein